MITGGAGSGEVSLLVVLAVALAIWVAVFFYIWRLDALAQDLRRRLERGAGQEREPSSLPTATLTKRTAPEQENTKGTNV